MEIDRPTSSPPSSSSFPSLPDPALASTYPIRTGNFVRPLVDGVQTYRRICAAVDAAKRSVWVVVSFYSPKFRFPDGRGDLWTVLKSAADRGVDVRLLCWRNAKFFNSNQLFGTPQELEMLQQREVKVKIRWDESGEDEKHCHHEKSWLVDVGKESEVVFTGGITLSSGSGNGESGHAGPHYGHHDTYCELKGPSATDMHHHFVQRWNGARCARNPGGCFPSLTEADDLPFPTRVSPSLPNASSAVRVIRTIRPNAYTTTDTSKAISSYRIEDGEQSIYEEYKAAIKRAKGFIYCENQHLCDEEMMSLLYDALNRGVKVIFVVPGKGGIYFLINYARGLAESWQSSGGDESTKPRYADVFLTWLPKLATHQGFTLAGLANSSQGNSNHIYVHSKLMIVDDEWFTLGSANFVDISWKKDHTELNFAVWDPTVASQLRRDLFAEHGLVDPDLPIDSAFEKLRAVAEENYNCLMASQPFHGLIFKINAALYGDVPEYLTFTERAQLHASYRLISLHQTFSPMWKGIFG